MENLHRLEGSSGGMGGLIVRKKDSNTTSIWHTGSHKSFPILMGEMLKVHFNIYLYSINNKEINICHSNIHKHAFHKKLYECYKYFE